MVKYIRHMLPQLNEHGLLPPGIYNGTLPECLNRFGNGSVEREKLARLLTAVVSAASKYETVKRVLVLGSFVTAKVSPNDLDYSIIVSVLHKEATIAAEHRRFLVPYDARLFYGVDRGFLVIPDYPVESYAESLLFISTTRDGRPCGIIEIAVTGDRDDT